MTATTTRWCEHDEVAAECLHCRLRLAEATNELLEIRLARTLELISNTLNEFERSTMARTHYEGCEADHPLCKLVKNIRTLTRGEDNADREDRPG